MSMFSCLGKFLPSYPHLLHSNLLIQDCTNHFPWVFTSSHWIFAWWIHCFLYQSELLCLSQDKNQIVYFLVYVICRFLLFHGPSTKKYDQYSFQQTHRYIVGMNKMRQNTNKHTHINSHMQITPFPLLINTLKQVPSIFIHTSEYVFLKFKTPIHLL